MTIPRIQLQRFLAALAVGVALSNGITLHAYAAPADSDMTRQEWARHQQEMIKVRLAKTAERLEIKSSQQNAWQTYAEAYTNIISSHGTRPDAAASASTLMRYRADRAADYAKKLSVVADATAKLEEILTPDQRKTFDAMAQHSHHRSHHWSPWWHKGMHGSEDTQQMQQQHEMH